MKVTSVIDNLTCSNDLCAEHGLSLYCECDNHRFLLDTGQSDGLIRNARQLNIDLTKVDYLILSHGHYDHIGGLEHFLAVNHQAKIVVGKQIFGRRYHHQRPIGELSVDSIPSDRLIFVNEPLELSENLFVMPAPLISDPADRHIEGFFRKDDGVIKKDMFVDEIYVVVIEDEREIILSGCSHNGIRNIVDSAETILKLPVGAIVGGLHLKEASAGQIGYLSEYFNRKQISNIYTCHCTGYDNFISLKKTGVGAVEYLSCGMTIEL